jgi:carbamoyltransferase
MLTFGISANEHDAALAVIDGAQILFASHAERYSRRKNDPHLHPDLVAEALRYGEPNQIPIINQLSRPHRHRRIFG